LLNAFRLFLNFKTGTILSHDHDRSISMTDTVLFGALMAALVHDIGHPGKTNRFMTRTDHALAIQYNDQSVLENMHVFTGEYSKAKYSKAKRKRACIAYYGKHL
jgi:hypothetical protein